MQRNQWIAFFTSTENRHALPLFTSLLNMVCAYDPVGYGVPYNHLMFTDSREPLVECALQVLCVTLDNEPNSGSSGEGAAQGSEGDHGSDVSILLRLLSHSLCLSPRNLSTDTNQLLTYIESRFVGFVIILVPEKGNRG